MFRRRGSMMLTMSLGCAGTIVGFAARLPFRNGGRKK
jgi:hypothetical protein